jgi:hypothetical protein
VINRADDTNALEHFSAGLVLMVVFLFVFVFVVTLVLVLVLANVLIEALMVSFGVRCYLDRSR